MIAIITEGVLFVALVAAGSALSFFVLIRFTRIGLRAPQSVMEAINPKNVMRQQALTAQNELQKRTFQAR